LQRRCNYRSNRLGSAQGPTRGAHRLGRQALFPGEVKQQGLVAGQMIEDRQMEPALGEKIANVAAIQTSQSEKPHQPLFVAGKKAEREEGDLHRQFSAIFTIPGAFH